MKIEYVEFGIANNFGDVIEINENLKKYPQLLQPILQHELAHTDKFFSKEDLMLDLSSSHDINQWELIKFMIKHPKSLTQLSPIYYSRKRKIVYDLNLLLYYVMFILLISLAIYVGVII